MVAWTQGGDRGDMKGLWGLMDFFPCILIVAVSA